MTVQLEDGSQREAVLEIVGMRAGSNYPSVPDRVPT